MKNVAKQFCVVIICATLSVMSCRGDSKNETVRGLQEENIVLREKIGGLEIAWKTTKEENQALQQNAKKDFEQHVANLKELHRGRIAQLEGEIASLRLELGAVQREKLALQETLDREPRIETANRQRYQIELVVMGVLLLSTLLLLGYVAFRYRAVGDRLHHLAMERVSELRLIGGHHGQKK